MTDDEIIAVVQAHKEGKSIEYRAPESWPYWCPVLPSHRGFDFLRLEYRVKPEPRKPREWDIVVLSDGTTIIAKGPIAKVPFNSNITETIRVREVIE